MADNNDNRRIRLGKPAMTNSARRERVAANPPIPRGGRGRVRGRGRGIDASSSSQAAGPSQVLDPTQYEQLQYEEPQQPQYEEQPHYDVEEEDQPHMADEAQGEEIDGYPGGPMDLELLPDFGNHLAYHVWVNTIPGVS